MSVRELKISAMYSLDGNVAQPTEVRHNIRYPLRARAQFVWVGRDGQRHEARGYSRDVSEDGAYILTKTCPPVGATVHLAINFPYVPDPARSRRLEVNGRVMRVDLLLANKSRWGFAIASSPSDDRQDREPHRAPTSRM